MKLLEQSSFSDLDKVRLEILREKILNGMEELKDNPGQQWTQLRLEKPLLEFMLNLIELEN